LLKIIITFAETVPVKVIFCTIGIFYFACYFIWFKLSFILNVVL